MPFALTVEAVAEAAARAGVQAGAPVEAPLLESDAAALRRGYLAEARLLAGELEARWRAAPPRWNAPTGDAFVDRLAWFRYVEAA
jgi:hypothetical protein